MSNKISKSQERRIKIMKDARDCDHKNGFKKDTERKWSYHFVCVDCGRRKTDITKDCEHKSQVKKLTPEMLNGWWTTKERDSILKITGSHFSKESGRMLKTTDGTHPLDIFLEHWLSISDDEVIKILEGE